MNNESSYGSFKNLKSFFWYSPRAATELQWGGIAWEAAQFHCVGYAYGVWWCITQGIHPVTVVAVGLSPFVLSVRRLKPRENCPKLLLREVA